MYFRVWLILCCVFLGILMMKWMRVEIFKCVVLVIVDFMVGNVRVFLIMLLIICCTLFLVEIERVVM